MKISLKCKERNPNPYRLYEEWQTDVIERAKGITTATRTAAGTAVVEIERLNMYVGLYFPGRHQLCKNSIFQHIHPSIYPFVRPSIHSFAHSKGFKNQTSWLYYIWEREEKKEWVYLVNMYHWVKRYVKHIVWVRICLYLNNIRVTILHPVVCTRVNLTVCMFVCTNGGLSRSAEWSNSNQWHIVKMK